MFWFTFKVILRPISKNVTGFTFHASSHGIRRKLWAPNYFVLLEWNSQCCALCKVFFFLSFNFPFSSLLPALLVRLTQISATVSMAAPMLEFLSGVHWKLFTFYSNFKSFYFFCHNCGRTIFKQVSFIYRICTPVSRTANIKASLLFVCHTQIHSGKSLLLAIF